MLVTHRSRRYVENKFRSEMSTHTSKFGIESPQAEITDNQRRHIQHEEARNN